MWLHSCVTVRVRIERTSVTKSLPTHRELVRLLSGVSELVLLAAVLLRKTLSTLWAVVGLRSCVSDHVVLEMTLLSETLPTLRAGMRLLSCVNEQVSLETYVLSKTLPTLWAAVSGGFSARPCLSAGKEITRRHLLFFLDFICLAFFLWWHVLMHLWK